MSADIRRAVAYILPIFNEANNIDLLHRTLSEVTDELAERYRINFIYINDGSKDESLIRLRLLADSDERVTVIDLSRNFGHQIAVTAGLDYVDADAVIIMDTDLQDPPSVSLELIKNWERGYEVVYAQRRSRQDTLFKKSTARLFYWILRKIAAIDIPANTGDFRLLDRKVVDELRKFREHDRFLRGLVTHIGFRQTAVLFDLDKRHAGVTGYPLRKMLRFAADGILGFSTFPLKMITRFGYFVSFLSFLGIIYTLWIKLFVSDLAVPGWAFIATCIFFLGGIQIVMLGVLGSYLGRIYTQVKGRPLYSVSSIRTGFAKDSSDSLADHDATTLIRGA